MFDKLRSPEYEIQPCGLPGAVARTIARATDAANRQPRVWVAAWITIVLTATMALAFLAAPVIAYMVPLTSLLIASHAGIRLR